MRESHAWSGVSGHLSCGDSGAGDFTRLLFGCLLAKPSRTQAEDATVVPPAGVALVYSQCMLMLSEAREALIVACSLVSSLGEVTIWRLSGCEGSGVYVCGKVYMGILLLVEFVFCIR